MKFYLICMLLLCFIYQAKANEYFDPFLARKCCPSKGIKVPEMYDLQAKSSNDLTRTYSRYINNVNKAFVYGRVLDPNCRPVMGVSVKFWHTHLNINGTAEKLSGMTTTNNLGEFIFATFIPSQKAIKGRILVVNEGELPFLTEIYLDKTSSFANKKSSFISHWILQNSQQYQQNYLFEVDIVLPYDFFQIRY
jgi:hypothetical protein